MLNKLCLSLSLSVDEVMVNMISWINTDYTTWHTGNIDERSRVVFQDITLIISMAYISCSASYINSWWNIFQYKRTKSITSTCFLRSTFYFIYYLMCDDMKICALIPSLTVESMIGVNGRIDFVTEVCIWLLTYYTWALYPYKDHLSRYRDYHYKEKAIVKPYYLHNGDLCISKKAFHYHYVDSAQRDWTHTVKDMAELLNSWWL